MNQPDRLIESQEVPLTHPSGGALLDALASVPRVWQIVSSLLVFVGLSLWAMVGESSTFDEGVHLSAGYAYLATGDYRLNLEHPPLGKVIAALPLLFQEVHWPRDVDAWDSAREWSIGFKFLYQCGNNPDDLLFWGRLSTIFWGAVLIVAVFAVSHDLFGSKGAFVSICLATFSPTFIAHSHLVTTDVIVTTFMFLAIYSIWRLFRDRSYRWSLYLGFMMGGALTAKYSSVVLLIIGVGMGWVILSSRKDGRNPANAAARHSIFELVSRTAIAMLLAWIVVWGVYGFRYSISPGSSNRSADGLVGESGSESVVQRLAPLPEGYLHGFALMRASMAGRRTYAMGSYSGQGLWWYFPFAFLVKTPVPALILMGWACFALRDNFRSGSGLFSLLVIPQAIYWVVAIGTGMNIGVRHILPVFPFLFVIAGGISSPSSEPRSKLGHSIVVLLLTTTAAGTIWAAPYYLPYFNWPATLIAKRHYLLTDSNLDWGQDLARLKRYMDQHGIKKVKLAYFGTASPRHLGLQHEYIYASDWHAQYRYYEPEWQAATSIDPGDYVAVSAHLYRGSFLEDSGYYLKLFDGVAPLSEIGHSILLFRVPDRGH